MGWYLRTTEAGARVPRGAGEQCEGSGHILRGAKKLQPPARGVWRLEACISLAFEEPYTGTPRVETSKPAHKREQPHTVTSWFELILSTR